jgi:two-component system, OmpR family, response regulator
MTQDISGYAITLDDDVMVSKIIEKITGINSIQYKSAKTLLQKAETHRNPTAVFIDIHLDDNESGLDIIPELREIWPFTPLIVVTGDMKDDMIGHALAAGADDFVRKPINAVELRARLKARVAQMTERASRDQIAVADMTYDRNFRTMVGGGKIRHLSQTESRLWECLLEARGMVIPRSEVKRKVWGSIKVSDNALDKKLFDLRAHVKETSHRVHLKSVYGSGICLEWEDTGE